MEVEIGKMDETVLQKHKAWSRIDGHQYFRSGKGDRKTIRQRWKGTRQSKKMCTRLPWWVSSSESAFQHWGHWFDAWSGKTPPSARHLSPCATAAEPVCCNCWSSRAREPVLHGRSHHNEKPATREQPPLAKTGESLHTAMKIQCS